MLARSRHRAEPLRPGAATWGAWIACFAPSMRRAVWIAAESVPSPATEPRWRRVRGFGAQHTCDYAWGLRDGSRLHLQCFGARYRVHRDRFDPARSLLAHGIAETPLVPALAALWVVL